MIDSPANPTVKLLRSLLSAKGRREHGLFLAEGVRLVQDGLASGSRPAYCLYSEPLLTRTERGRELFQALRSLAHSSANVEAASERGIEAACERAHPEV